MSVENNLESIVAHIGDLPAIPKIVAQVMELTEKPGVPVSEVSALIEGDIGLAARLLKVSNSSYYGMRESIGTLKLALVILGIKEVRNIVVGISVMDTLNDKTTDFLLQQEGLWDHSTKVASLSKKLGLHMELNLQGEDFIAGLLHDIGKLVLWKQIPEEYEDIYHAAKERGVPLYELEYEELGFDHADVAGVLAHKWSLPESLVHALQAHHPRADRPIADMKDPSLCAIVRIANRAARENFFAEDADSGDFLSCTDEEAWAILYDSFPTETTQERFDLLYQYSVDIEGTTSLTF